MENNLRRWIRLVEGVADIPKVIRAVPKGEAEELLTTAFCELPPPKGVGFLDNQFVITTG
jgi:hypothetical protein